MGVERFSLSYSNNISVAPGGERKEAAENTAKKLKESRFNQVPCKPVDGYMGN